MPFNYYYRLSRRQQSIYRQSDSIVELALPRVGELRPTVLGLDDALKKESRAEVRKLSARLARGISEQLRIAPVDVKVLKHRPSDDWGELHGLYEPVVDGAPALITVWMQTAKRKRVVAFKTYLRTLLHEVSHHVDYEYLRLPESFHTEGFYKRESYLYKILTSPQAEPGPYQHELPLNG